MRFHSITGANHNEENPFFRNRIRKISEVDLKAVPDVNFYYSLFDQIFYNIDLVNCLDSISINILKKRKKSKIFIDYQYEVISIEDVENIKTFVETYEIPLSKLIIVVQDNLQKDFLLKNFKDLQIANSIAIFARHYFIAGKGSRITEQMLENKKFSLLIRRHADWRLRFLLTLNEKCLLDNFIYSYLAADNETNNYLTAKTLQHNAEISKKNKKLLKKIPIKVAALDNMHRQDSLDVFRFLNSADINIIVETMYNQAEYSSKNRNKNNYEPEYAPTDLSEKTLKSISLGKPFIVVATPFFLESLKNLGYKTFDPFINEKYDLETDNVRRLELITDEIDRLSKLTNEEFNDIVNQCNKIAQYNKCLFLEHLEEYNKIIKDL